MILNASRFTQELCDCRDTSLVGGKGANLGTLVRAGFPVPLGFVVNTHAYRVAQMQSGSTQPPTTIPAEIADEIRRAYRGIGSGSVAIRSSATAEDMAAASMAGQYETFLDVEGDEQLLATIIRCWASLDSPRIRAYLSDHGIDPSGVAMAVVVQRLVAADVAGVLFTANPNNGFAHREMLIEASWGLGESVVSGRVQPDVLRIDRETGRVISAKIADKQVHLAAGAHEEQQVDDARRRQPCLRGRDVYRLWQLGHRAAEHFGAPQDIEWAIADGQLYLLQSRPITTIQDAEAHHRSTQAAVKHLRSESAAGRGPWVLHNLAETLPHPTPLSWSVIRRFMSGAGGFGAMYRQAGFEPSEMIDREGFLDCIAGRIYMDASRAPEMFFKDFPFAYDLEQLKRSPDAAQSPPTLPRGPLLSRLKIGRKLKVVNAKLRSLSSTLDRDVRTNLFGEITGYVACTKPIDLRNQTVDWLLELWQEHERLVLDTFAPHLLMPTLISGMAMSDLRSFLQEHFWNDDPDALAQLISSGGRPDRTMLADAELYEVGKGNRPLEQWIAEHGHRASGEFDLAAPRWREQPQAIREMAARLATGDSPLERYRRNAGEVAHRIAALRAQLNATDQREFDRLIDVVRRYVAFREDGKDFFMLGYDLLRDLALEAGRRLEIGDDVFYLDRDDLFAAVRVGFAPHHVIEQRKIEYRAEAQLSMPRVIDERAIAELAGETALTAAADSGAMSGGHEAFAISAGKARGAARILRSPTDVGEIGTGYILVCPSTDPSWTPLFVSAAGLVLECGGTLSHGAVVAREMGLPAVVLPDATRIFKNGEMIRVDADRGWVGPADETFEAEASQAVSASVSQAQAIDPKDLRILPEMIPPPAGGKDRRAAKLRNVAVLIWTIFLIGFFALPESWVHRPTISLIDLFLWPIVRGLGKPMTVAIVAVGIAAITLILQRILTDNRRLLVAKQRAANLVVLAESLPKDSPRRQLLLQLASPVQWRTLGAALVPVGLLLGPMVLPFVWFEQRVEPAAWNAAPGSSVQVVATVDSNWDQPLNIEMPRFVQLDESSPSSRTLPPIRRTLEHLLSLYRQPRVDPAAPWELTVAPDYGREQAANDLQAYLDAGVPPQGITWLVRTPENFSGTFSIAIRPAGHAKVTLSVVVGDQSPPAASSVAGPSGSPIKEVRLIYPKPRVEPFFWRPLHALAGHDRIPLASRLAAIDIGWIWLYILVYLPALFLIRAVLKIA